MPLNGPREGSVALSLSLSSNRVCKDVPLLARHTRPECRLRTYYFMRGMHVYPHMRFHMYVSPFQLYLKIYFGRGPARLRSETNCRRRNIECLG